MFISAFLTLGVTILAFGSIGAMFDEVIASFPKHLTSPGAAGIHTIQWYTSNVALTTLSFGYFRI